MMTIYYENSKGEKIDLLSDVYHIVETDLFDSDWDDSGDGFEKSIEIDVMNKRQDFCENMNRLYDVVAYDSEIGAYGKLYVNGSYLTCNISRMEKEGWKGNVYAYVYLTFFAPKLAWIDVETKEFISSLGVTDDGKHYPYDYPYDYALLKTGRSAWDIDNIKPSDFTLVISGEIENPEIIINGNRHKVFVNLLYGEYMIIDSITKTITKHNIDGSSDNVFDYRDLESNVFKKVNPGMNIIEWSGTFSFKMYVYKERREPRWS